MNRAERRKAAKNGQVVPKEPVLNLKVSDFTAMMIRSKEDAKKKAVTAAIHEIDQQIIEADRNYSLDIDAMVLWTLHVHCGFGKARLEKFYQAMVEEHIAMRKFYEMDDTYPERLKLKEQCDVDVEELNRKFEERWDDTCERSKKER